jgi:polyhydroxyalkanoate synthesis regulator phasin
MSGGDDGGTVSTATTGEERLAMLLGESDAEEFRDRWQTIQSTFVDEPKQSVEQADALVTDVIQQLTETFQLERRSLEQQLASDNVSTEDRRVTLQRYRSFFERLLQTS